MFMWYAKHAWLAVDLVYYYKIAGVPHPWKIVSKELRRKEGGVPVASPRRVKR